jgi:hypothetical protein
MGQTSIKIIPAGDRSETADRVGYSLKETVRNSRSFALNDSADISLYYLDIERTDSCGRPEHFLSFVVVGKSPRTWVQQKSIAVTGEFTSERLHDISESILSTIEGSLAP